MMFRKEIIFISLLSNSSDTPLGSLRLLLLRPPHEIYGGLYVLDPAPAHEEASNFCLSDGAQNLQAQA